MTAIVNCFTADLSAALLFGQRRERDAAALGVLPTPRPSTSTPSHHVPPPLHFDVEHCPGAAWRSRAPCRRGIRLVKRVLKASIRLPTRSTGMTVLIMVTA